ncbi:winged helix-turn-helix transcriptional regulator [Candidatus Kaiserbacteria bacterium]|nr:winged helix-turn-helix transcriptional regulator [Candidatus Kaiserbacteria bacterium]
MQRSLEALRTMGLDEKEANIYLALLKRPRMTVSQISRETSIKRASCYEYIDQLLAKDYVTREPSGKRTYYSAVAPQRVFTTFRRNMANIEGAILEMGTIHEYAVNRPRVTYFEGKRQLKLIYEDLFKTVGVVYSIFPPTTFFENFTEQDYDDFDKSITQYAIASRDLFVADKHYKTLQEIRKKNGPSNKVSKKLPDWFDSNVDVLIYSEKVALISLRDLSAVVIENKDIADLFRNMHSLMWKAV